MDRAKRFIMSLEHMLNAKKRKHLIGGILLSASLFFGGLALTVMTTKIEENEEDEQQND